MFGNDFMGAGFKAQGVAFGTSESLTKTSGLSNMTDTKTGTLSFWSRCPVSTSGTMECILGKSTPDETKFWVYQTSSNAYITVDARQVSGPRCMEWRDVATSYNDNTWHHFLISWDLANASNRHTYVDDSPVSGTWTTYINANIDYTTNSTWRIGSNDNIDYAEIWFDHSFYTDFSVLSNRRKFIDANGKPVFLGNDGALPFGSSPDIFLSGNVAAWHTNKGTGGGFIENGTLSSASSSPSD